MRKQQVNIQNLADEPQLEDYQQKPVQNYGMSLLKGMGFSESKGIGKSKNNQLNDIYVLKPRPRGQGLGAQTHQQAQKQKFQIGDKILITEQPHKGLTGYVNQIISQEYLSIQLHPSKSIVKINIKSLKKISKSQMKKIQQQSQKTQTKKKKRIKWAIPQIRVKVTDPKSQFYLKKVIITQLINDKQFQCRDEVSGKILNNLTQNDIQTVIPKNGGMVVILKGQHIGAKAIVMDRKKSKGQVTVQTQEQLQMIKVSEDDISQYVQM